MIAIVSVRGFATIQDGGRRGHAHEGVPPGGALVPELLARANAAVGNEWSAAAIELVGELTIEARADAFVAPDDGVARRLAAGARASLRARYVAIAGGVDAPAMLGGRGALVGAGIGRLLRAGDRLDAAGAAGAPRALPPLDLDAPIRVVAGPDLARFDAGLDALVAATFAISSVRDRAGTRLVGPPIARCDDDDAASTPMVRGAIQVPRSGEPIVLGPDHPTTGGYPVVAVVVRADLGRFAAQAPSAVVRFRAVSVDDARAAWTARRAEFFADSFRARKDVAL